MSKEIVELMKRIIEDGNLSEEVAMKYCPELKESEDEKVRKDMIETIKKESKDFPSSVIAEKSNTWIAWLEKQGEKKPIDPDTLIQQRVDTLADIVTEQNSTDKAGPKFKVGDWVMLDRPVLITKVEDMPYNTYQYWTFDGTWFGNSTNAKLWTIQDAKDGDVLVASDKSLFIYDGSINENGSVGFHIAFAKDTDIILNSDDGCGWEEKDSCQPATKEQRDFLLQKMHEAGYEWDAEKKELKKIEKKPAEWTMDNIEELTEFENAMMHIGSSFFGEHQGLDPNDTFVVKEQAKILLEMAPKQEWSEEDDQYLLVCKNALAKYQASDKWDAEIISRWLENKLKSLRPQTTWKPSEGQLSCLGYIIDKFEKDNSDFKDSRILTLRTLEEQLKKLREE